MKKNYSQKIFKPTQGYVSIIKNSSIEKPKANNSPPKKAFTRKPAGGYLPLSKKRGSESIHEFDSTMQQTNFSEVLQTPTKQRFISSRSQASLNNSISSKSNLQLSLINSFNDEISFSRLLPESSIIPEIDESETNQRELFRRKNMFNAKTPTFNRKNGGEENKDISIMTTKFVRKIDNAEQQTKLQSSEFSDLSKIFYNQNVSIIGKNIVQSSKNSSKDSMRKSNSSNSLIKKGVLTQCQQCEFHQRGLRQLTSQNQRLERIVKNKDEQITNLTKKLQQNEKRIKQFEKKVKEIQKMDYQNKFHFLEQQLAESHQQCSRMKQAYSKSIQELKYKNVQNSTLKKIQDQFHSLERKMQMLVAERNELRQRLSNVNISQKSSYMNYPSTHSKQSKTKSPNNLSISHSIHTEIQKKRQIYTSRNDKKNDFQFDEEDQSESDRSFMTQNDGFMKKKVFVQCYDDSSQSEIISLSEESTF